MDAKAGLVEYVASDESIDSYNEVIRAKGWRFDRFVKNSPFVDSHRYDSLEFQLGSVVDFRVAGDKLVEVAQWAIDVPENRLAQLGFKMTNAGHLKAVSVGFAPEEVVTPGNQGAYRKELAELGLPEGRQPSLIYVKQQQLELSACVIGANPNALARAYKAEVLSDDDLDFLSQRVIIAVSGNTGREHAGSATFPADADPALQRARLDFQSSIKTLALKIRRERVLHSIESIAARL